MSSGRALELFSICGINSSMTVLSGTIRYIHTYYMHACIHRLCRHNSGDLSLLIDRYFGNGVHAGRRQDHFQRVESRRNKTRTDPSSKACPFDLLQATRGEEIFISSSFSCDNNVACVNIFHSI